MGSRSRIAARNFIGLTLASALCLPAAALAGQFDFYIKLPPIEGDSGKSEAKGEQIEIQSFSWGATQTGTYGHGGGGGAGKVSMQDISAPSATSGSPKAKGEKGGTEDINIGVGELQQAGEAEITLKGNTGTGGAAKLPGKRTPPTVTLKRGMSADAGTESVGGVQVAVGDVTGDGSPTASGLPTGKRQHKPMSLTAPLDKGSVTVRGRFPVCTVGARYPSLELGGAAARYRLTDVVVTSCASGSSAGESLPMEEVSFNYAKIEF
jgi:type VI protein secretion system component Hcp